MKEFINNSPKIMCPFYMTHSRRAIRCEAPINDASYIESNYKTDGERSNQLDLFCKDKWKECPIAKCNNEKWDKLLHIDDNMVIENKGVISNAGRRF